MDAMEGFPNYDNRYVLDITYGAWLILGGVALFVIYFGFALYYAVEDNCTSYECGSVGIELATIIVFFFATIWFVAITYPVQLREEMVRIMDFASCDDIGRSKSLGERFIWGTNYNLLMWLFLLATLPFLAIPIWAYADGDIGLESFLIYFFIFLIVVLILVFWLVATFPESMIKNNCRGSSYIYDSCLACCLGALYDPSTHDFSANPESLAGFIQRNLGGDFLLGAWFFFLASLAQLVYSIYYVCVDYDDGLVYTIFFGSLLLAIGSGLFVYTAYPENAFSRYWWCMSTCQQEETPKVDEEKERLTNKK